ncbi:Uncharacterized protein OBRU01_13562, partial [Operophtera brumata]
SGQGVSYYGGSNVRTQNRLPPRPIGSYSPGFSPNVEPISLVNNPQPIYQPPQPVQADQHQPIYQSPQAIQSDVPQPPVAPKIPPEPASRPINSFPRPLPPWSWSRPKVFPAEINTQENPSPPDNVLVDVYPESSPVPLKYGPKALDFESPVESDQPVPVEGSAVVLQPEKAKISSSPIPEELLPNIEVNTKPEPLAEPLPEIEPVPQPSPPGARPSSEEPLTDPIPELSPEQPVPSYPEPIPISNSQSAAEIQQEPIPATYESNRFIEPVNQPPTPITPALMNQPSVPTYQPVQTPAPVAYFPMSLPPRPDYQPMQPPGPDYQPMQPPGPDYQPMQPPGPDYQSMQPPRPDYQPMQPPGPDYQSMQPPRPDYQPMHPPGPDYQSMQPPGPDYQPMQPPGPDYQPMQPPGPDYQPMQPPGPDYQPMQPPRPDYQPMHPPAPIPIPMARPPQTLPPPEPAPRPPQPRPIPSHPGVPSTSYIPISAPEDDIIPLTEFQCIKGDAYYIIANECDTYIECQAARPTGECPHWYGFFSISGGDCSQYLMCQKGKATLMNCPFGLVFNDELNSCDWPENVPQCHSNAFNDFTCPTPPEDDPDLLTKFRYGNDCGIYMACLRGHPRLLRCDSGLSFDENSQVCIDSDLVTDCRSKETRYYA